MVVAMEVYEVLNRSPNPPTRTIQDRPHGETKQLLWETVDTQVGANQQPEAKGVIRPVKKYTRHPEKT